MTKILWFSRHNFTAEQLQALEEKLGEVEVTQVNGSPANVHVPFEGSINGGEVEMLSPMKEQVQNYDVLAIVAPIGLQQQFLSVADGRPVIIAQNKRVLIKNEDGSEDKYDFIFDGWKQLKKIEVVIEDF